MLIAPWLKPEMMDFIRFIKRNPDDNTARLVFADWLDENGDPERAEFIRIQCKIGLANPFDFERRERQLLGAFAVGRRSWEEQEFYYLEQTASDGRKYRTHFMQLANAEYWAGPAHVLTSEGMSRLPRYVFRRGFVESVTCTWQDWLDWGMAITGEGPIRRVDLLNDPIFDLSTNFESWEARLQFGNWRAIGQGRSIDEAARRLFGAVWPGVQFYFPNPPGVFIGDHLGGRVWWRSGWA